MKTGHTGSSNHEKYQWSYVGCTTFEDIKCHIGFSKFCLNVQAEKECFCVISISKVLEVVVSSKLSLMSRTSNICSCCDRKEHEMNF